MQRRKKQLLGLAGLALVAVITIIAFAMPGPGASAAEFRDGVGIQVIVGETDPGDDKNKLPEASVNTINGESTSGDDQIVTTKRRITVGISYKRADSVTVRLKNAKTGEVMQVIPVKNCEASYSSTVQTCTAEFDLNSDYLPEDVYNGDKFIVEAVARRDGLESVYSATAEFIYRSAYLYSKGEYQEQTKNPVIYAVLSEDVKLAVLQVFDANGKPVLTKDITFSYADADPATGLYKITLPLKENNLPAGKYTAVLTAYNTTTPTEDGLVSISTIRDIPYSPDGSPLPPDTGSNAFNNLNISRSDYILTGLLAFGAVTLFAVGLIIRRNKR